MSDPARLRLLREFAEHGTMTAVGEACGLTSSAVSQHLASLERQAGVPLFERAGRRVRLTAEGKRLVRHAHIVLNALDAAEGACALAGFRPNVIHTADDYALALRMVRERLGASLVPELVATVVGVPDGVVLRPISITITRATRALVRNVTPAVSALLEPLRAAPGPAAGRREGAGAA